ncbi:hypothetical protein M0813_09375 [Anaeramoeba flamelloides]|uniref:BRISC and BRCA1-A complex member 1 n=1 Tax=Anaeramoeba flamelloides TaxID=1746091 RepID=A0ABQ8X6Y5_9EUKA|nr:hypothetical protein M0813_09375 [Anaeramoeba flamelloides]
MSQTNKKYLPERILFCITRDSLINNKATKDKMKRTIIECIVEAIKIFIKSKQMINPNHEFALISYSSIPQFHCTFDKDPTNILQKLERISTLKRFEHPSFDLAKFFKKIDNMCQIKKMDQADYLYRVILIYTRPNVIPSFNEDFGGFSLFEEMSQKAFTWDTILIHHKSKGKKNKIEKLFTDFAESFLIKPYFLEDKSCQNIYNKMSLLLSHPLQRKVLNEMNPIEF